MVKKNRSLRGGLHILFKFPDAIIKEAILISADPKVKDQHIENVKNINLQARFFDKAWGCFDDTLNLVKVHFDTWESVSFNEWFEQNIGEDKKVKGFSCSSKRTSSITLRYKESI